jgi:hypothetical protein
MPLLEADEVEAVPNQTHLVVHTHEIGRLAARAGKDLPPGQLGVTGILAAHGL